MKLNKLFNAIILGLLLLSFTTGCGEETKVNQDKEENKTEEIKGKCSAEECIKLLETTNTIEEMNDIIGFEGKKSDYSEEYSWKLSDKTSINVTYSGDKPIIQATLDKKSLINEKNDFTVYNDIKKLLDSGKSLAYDEMVSKLGGVEGTLAGKTSTSKRYIWVDTHEQTFSATFSDNSDGKCSIISLR